MTDNLTSNQSSSHDSLKSSTQTAVLPGRWLSGIAWLPILIILLTLAVLWKLDLRTSYESPTLVIAMRIIFSMLASLAVASLMVRGFLIRPTPGLLIMGCSVLLWGVGSFIAPFIGQGNPNIIVTIQNLSVWLAACGYLAGVILSRTPQWTVAKAGLWVGISYTVTLCLLWLITQAAISGWFPVFFVQGQGGTLVRQAVLGSAISMLVLTVALLRPGRSGAGSTFAFWYALALLLMAIASLVVMFDPLVGSALTWTFRAADFLGGAYMFVAAVVYIRQSRDQVITLGETSSKARYQYGVAIASVIAATVLRLVILQALEFRAIYLTFYPAVILAALYGGLRPGLVAIALSALLATYFWIEPVGQLLITDPADWLSMAIFAISCTAIALVIEFMHRANIRAQKAEMQVKITAERELAAKALYESEDRLRFALETMHAGAWDLNLEDQTAVRSLEHDRIFGYAELLPQWTYEMFLDHVVPEDRTVVEEKFRHAMETQGDWSFECRIRRDDGHVRWIWAAGRHRSGAAGSSRRMAGIIQDITERKRAEQVLHATLQRLNILVSSMRSSILFVGEERIEMANQTFCDYFEVRETPAELVGLTAPEMIQKIKGAHLHPDKEADRIREIVRRGQPVFGEEIAMRNGRTCLRDFIPIVMDGKLYGRIWSHMDITERKRAEDEIQRLLVVVRNERDRLSALIHSINDEIWFTDAEKKLTLVNPAVSREFGLSVSGTAEVKRIAGSFDVYRADGTPRPIDEAPPLRALRGEVLKDQEEIVRIPATGELRYRQVSAAPVKDPGGAIIGSVAVAHDITELRKQGRELLTLNRVLHALSDSGQAMMRADNEADYLREVCKIIEKDCGYTMIWIGFAENNEAKSVTPVAYAGFEEGYLETLKITWADTERGRGPTGTAVRTGKVSMCKNMLTDPAFEPWRKEALKRGYASSIVLPLKADHESYGALTIYSKEPAPFSEDEVNLLSELAGDLSHGILAIRLRNERARAEEQLKRTAEELERSNRDLEQFAYAASHDLKEPLRTVASFIGLLKKRFPENIDSEAKEFIDMAINGAERMDILINSLLEFSRVGTKVGGFKAMSMKDAADIAMGNLRKATEETGARISFDSLPVITADKLQMSQLLQNLIGNAIKFCRGNIPEVHLSAQREEQQWVFGVHDNGIGIEPRFFDRIFLIFQRLHTQDKYGGTGIGLALCKRIVERHGGSIWVESVPDKGSTFYFTIPERREDE
jgi:PAS domain S-box-containing protein